MAQNPLGPPPFISQENSFDRWMRQLWQRIAIEGQIIWTQVIRPTVVKNTFFAGPTTGADAQADFRAMVAADLGTGTPDGTKFLMDDLTWQVPPVGYATGQGGIVTQITSRTTGVTLNKSCGEITLVSAAGTAAWQTFTVTNSVVAATDTIIVNQKSGTDLNMIHVTAVAAGSFNISFATTGGTTTEQPVFNFVIIKGVTS